jgi:hypothetical protein
MKDYLTAVQLQLGRNTLHWSLQQQQSPIAPEWRAGLGPSQLPWACPFDSIIMFIPTKITADCFTHYFPQLLISTFQRIIARGNCKETDLVCVISPQTKEIQFC